MGVLDKITGKKAEKKSASKKSATKKPAAKKTTKKTAPAEKKTAKNAKGISKKAYETILGPVVSEKAAHLSEQNVLTFKVAKQANKIEVRNAVREIYGVNPTRVNIVSVRGAWVRFGRHEGRQSDYKKALVHLPEGTTLDIFEGV